jgi:hypothetical protein
VDTPERVAHIVVEVGVWSPRRIDEEKTKKFQVSSMIGAGRPGPTLYQR